VRILFERGHAAWPGLALDPERFTAHVRGHLASAPDPAAAARSLNASDLYLACACRNRVPGAIDAFEGQYLRHLPALLARYPDALPLLDEIRQVLREKLLVGTAESPPRIAQYQGHGALLRWLQVTAMHTAIKLLPTSGRSGPCLDSQRIIDLLATEDPETEFLKTHYLGNVKRAFEDAFVELTAEQRNLLRARLIDGLSIDELAGLFHVHRATADRRVKRALTELLDRVKRNLKQHLALPSADLDSLLLLVRSRLELSLDRLLRTR
jgi:RNA polymerase sigma-70 factor (ECF subfamily)